MEGLHAGLQHHGAPQCTINELTKLGGFKTGDLVERVLETFVAKAQAQQEALLKQPHISSFATNGGATAAWSSWRRRTRATGDGSAMDRLVWRKEEGACFRTDSVLVQASLPKCVGVLLVRLPDSTLGSVPPRRRTHRGPLRCLRPSRSARLVCWDFCWSFWESTVGGIPNLACPR